MRKLPILLAGLAAALPAFAQTLGEALEQIGRASCRERV